MAQIDQVLAKFLLYISKRSCHTTDRQCLMTFWQGTVAPSCKKQLFRDKRFFRVSETCKNDPGPPFRLKGFFKYSYQN